MTVPAARAAWRAGDAGKSFRLCGSRSILFVAAWLLSSPAAAQVGAAVSVFSDDRFRGYTLSDGRPVGILDLSYDARNGLYGALSGSIVAARGEGLEPLGFRVNAGYAKRVSTSLTLDLGVTHAHYSSYASRGRHYTEAYVGLGGRLLSGRISISPDYLRSGLWTAYPEINGTVPAGRRFRLTGHVGLLVPFERRLDYYRYPLQLDWRLGAAADVGPVTANISWSGLGRGHDLYQERPHRRNALVLGLTYAL